MKKIIISITLICLINSALASPFGNISAADSATRKNNILKQINTGDPTQALKSFKNATDAGIGKALTENDAREVMEAFLKGDTICALNEDQISSLKLASQNGISIEHQQRYRYVDRIQKKYRECGAGKGSKKTSTKETAELVEVTPPPALKTITTHKTTPATIYAAEEEIIPEPAAPPKPPFKKPTITTHTTPKPEIKKTIEALDEARDLPPADRAASFSADDINNALKSLNYLESNEFEVDNTPLTAEQKKKADALKAAVEKIKKKKPVKPTDPGLSDAALDEIADTLRGLGGVD